MRDARKLLGNIAAGLPTLAVRLLQHLNPCHLPLNCISRIVENIDGVKQA
jgi:hypothetical protein